VTESAQVTVIQVTGLEKSDSVVRLAGRSPLK
jgi:hypothetical protein